MSAELHPPLARRPAPPRPPGRSPAPARTGWPAGACGGITTALAFGAIFPVIVAVPGRAAVRARRGAHGARRQPRDGHRHGRRPAPGRGLARGHPDRPDLAGPLLPRRRPERARHRGPPSVRRPQLARDRADRDRDHDGARDASSAAWPATSAAGVDAVLSRILDLIWAYPVVLLGDRARHLAGARRAQHRPLHALRQLAAGARAHHRLRLHPLRREAATRAGARAARARVRRRRARSRGWATCASCGARCCRTSPRRSSCSSR